MVENTLSWLRLGGVQGASACSSPSELYKNLILFLEEHELNYDPLDFNLQGNCECSSIGPLLSSELLM